MVGHISFLFVFVIAEITSCYGVCFTGDASCIFPCHCFRDTDCGKPFCPHGCADGNLGYNWRGLACQIGNVSPGKVTNQTGSATLLTTLGKSTDGNIDTNIGCEVVDASQGSGLAELWMDLGDLHKIFSVTIFFAADLCCERERINSEFQVGVSNNSREEAMCTAYDNPNPVTIMKMDCPTPIGRYVHFSRLVGSHDKHKAILCEVIVMGHRYIDCTHCPAGVECNDVTGCAACQGRYQPDCKIECTLGTYGKNCERSCGNCVSDSTCDATTGICNSGCSKWWVLDQCSTEIKFLQVNHNSVFLKIGNISSTSVELRWYQPPVARIIAKYFGYQIHYQRTAADEFPVESNVPYLPGSPINVHTVKNLIPNKHYWFEIQPYIEWDDSQTKFDSLYPVKAQAMTKCLEPPTPVMDPVSKSTLSPVHGKDIPRDQIEITYRPSPVNNRCENITRFQIEYRLIGTKQYLVEEPVVQNGTFKILPQYGGTYEIRIRVENGDGFQSVSTLQFITIQGPVFEESSTIPNLKLIVSGVVAGLGLLLIIIVGVVICKKSTRKRAQRPVQNPEHGGRIYRRSIQNNETSH